MIDQITIQQIIDRAEIAEVVGDFVSLKKRGVNYLGLCPFHNEKTPSFTVSPAKGIYKCFGCGKGGNSVNFIMDIEQLSYPEALKFLAKKYNIEIKEKEQTPEQIEAKNDRESILILNNYAKNFFMDALHKTDEGRSVGLGYFIERGFSQEIINKFELGYSPEKFDAFTQNAKKNSYKTEYLIKSGLSIDKNGRQFDRFHGRVMFPIHSLSGRVIAFGGRILKTNKKTAKYLNSPESIVYHKSDILYGIYFAKNAIMKTNNCFMVEGYTDVISMQQAGIENVVASSGTSLTINQIRLVKRFTPNLTIIYDGDQAGIKASLRGIDLILEQEMNVKVVPLPDGEDPDSFAKARSSEEFLKYIETHKQDFITFKASLLLNEAQNDPVKRIELLNDIVRTISVIPNVITRSVYIKECQHILNVKEEVLYSEINKRLKERNTKRTSKIRTQANTEKKTKSSETKNKELPYTKQTECERYEKEIIRLLLNYTTETIELKVDEDYVQFSLIEYIISEIEVEEFEFFNTQYRGIFEELSAHYKKGITLDEKHFSNHPDSQISQLTVDLINSKYKLSSLWTRDRTVSEIEFNTEIPSFILKYKLKRIKLKIAEIESNMKQAQQDNNNEKFMELMSQKMIFDSLKMKVVKEIGKDITLI